MYMNPNDPNEHGCFIHPASVNALSVTIPTGFLTLEDFLKHIDYQLKTDYAGACEDWGTENYFWGRMDGRTQERQDQSGINHSGPMDYEFDGHASHRIQSAQQCCFAPQVVGDDV